MILFGKLIEAISDEQLKSDIKDLKKLFGQSFSDLGKLFNADSKMIKKDVEESPIPVTEEIGVAAVIAIIVAAPKLVNVFTKALSKFINSFNDTFDSDDIELQTIISSIDEVTGNWQSKYIDGIQHILKFSGIYKKANIARSEQRYIAETILYTILAGFVVKRGFKSPDIKRVIDADSKLSADIMIKSVNSMKDLSVRKFLKKLQVL